MPDHYECCWIRDGCLSPGTLKGRPTAETAITSSLRGFSMSASPAQPGICSPQGFAAPANSQRRALPPTPGAAHPVVHWQGHLHRQHCTCASSPRSIPERSFWRAGIRKCCACGHGAFATASRSATGTQREAISTEGAAPCQEPRTTRRHHCTPGEQVCAIFDLGTITMWSCHLFSSCSAYLGSKMCSSPCYEAA